MREVFLTKYIFWHDPCKIIPPLPLRLFLLFIFFKIRMKILYCHDNIYKQSADGTVYSAGQFPYDYWKPFIEAFGYLVVAGRGKALTTEEDKAAMNISSGSDVSFVLFPNINTPQGRLKYYRSVDKRIKNVVSECDGVIIRAVSDLGWIVYKHAKAMNKPIAMEVTACAWDSTWNHGNALGKIYAPIRYWHDKIIARHADYALYVSKNFLQTRYPTNGETTNASNVRIERIDEGVTDTRLARIKMIEESNLPHVIGLIGNLDNRIKGVADAIKALAIVQEEKPGCFLFRHLGPGDPQPYQEQAKALGIEKFIHFDGMIQTGQAVFDWLDNIDLYLQPSYQEGVPRATIEAMSRGCPVIGSTAGGIPELIGKEWLHKPGDYKKLAELVLTMLDSPAFQVKTAGENRAAAKDYTEEILMPRRINFWKNFAEFIKKRQEKGHPDIKSLAA